ncbi:MAG: type II secretion system secretin GspD [Gammaproteobacteria bacterium]|nr:type II secretion system secretin GspD [Gammaproteobacteria bacterium]
MQTDCGAGHAGLAWILLLGLVCLWLSESDAQTTGDAPKQVAPALHKGEVLFNFQRADIEAVVKTVSQMTGRNFILDPRVKGKVTIISAKPVSKGAAYQIFVSAIKAQGFTAVSGPGGAVKIVPVAEGKQNAIVGQDDTPRGGEQMATHVVVIQHGLATQMVPLLRPLMAPTSQLSAYTPANALIITDYANNARRLLRIIDDIDQPVSSEVTVIPLEHASALDIADLIGRLSAPTQPARVAGQQAAAQRAVGSQRLSIVPDLRTNSLLVRTDNPGRLTQLRALISKLDVPAKPGGQTRVVYLKNAEATPLAEILRGLLAGEARARPTGAAGQAAATGTGAAGSLIQADEGTNALIIRAPDAVYNNLRSVIEKLDIPRAQVLVETLIVDIRTDKLSEIGVQWAGAGSSGETEAAALTQFPAGQVSLGAVLADPLSLAGVAGLTLAVLGSETTLPDGSTVRGLSALATALESEGYGTILSTPNILTLDNAEAEITVAQNVPFVTGSFAQATGTDGTVNPFQTVERQDVGLILRVKPQISEGDVIKLEIYQEVSNVDETPVGGATDITTRKRSVETTVAVNDGNTVVLGGLVDDRFQQNDQRVPGLSRIPILGALFRNRSKDKQKTSLMVFLRPKIVRLAKDTHKFTADRYSDILGEKRSLDPSPSDTLDRFTPGALVRDPASESDYEEEPFNTPEGDGLLGPPDPGVDDYTS